MKNLLVLLIVIFSSQITLFSQEDLPKSSNNKFLIQTELGLYTYPTALTEEDFYNYLQLSPFISAYYILNEHVSTGIRLGYLTNSYMPISLSFRTSLLKSKHELLLISSIGYSPIVSEKYLEGRRGGVYADFSLRGNIALTKNLSLLAGPSYYIQEYSISITSGYIDAPEYWVKQTFHEIGFTVGLEVKL